MASGKRTTSSDSGVDAPPLYEGLLAGLEEMAAGIRGEIELEGYDFQPPAPRKASRARQAGAVIKAGKPGAS